MPATFDASPIADIGSNLNLDVGADKAKALSIKDMMNREQMAQLALRSQKQDAATDAKIQDLLKGEKIDYSSPEGVMRTQEKINQISPKRALEFGMEANRYASGQVQAQVDQYELMDKQQALVVGAIDPIVAQARDMKAKGADDMTVNAFIAQQVPGALQTLRDTKLPNGQSALHPEVLKAVQSGPITLSRLEGFEAQTKKGQELIRQRLEQFKADTQARTAETRERAEVSNERHQRVMEEQGFEKIAAAKDKLKTQGFTDRQAELLASMADANVSLPAGLRSQAQIKATLDGLFAAHPDMSAAEITEGIRSGKLKLTAETKAAQTAGNQIGKVSVAVNEIEPFGRQVLEASKDIPRGSNLTMNGLMQMGETQIQNPKLLVLRAKLQALNNAYDQLAARGGTDKDKRKHVHSLFDARLNDENIRALVKAVNEEGAGAKEAADRTIGEVSGTQIPGTGGKTGGTPQVLRFDAQGNPIS